MSKILVNPQNELSIIFWKIWELPGWDAIPGPIWWAGQQVGALSGSLSMPGTKWDLGITGEQAVDQAEQILAEARTQSKQYGWKSRIDQKQGFTTTLPPSPSPDKSNAINKMEEADLSLNPETNKDGIKPLSPEESLANRKSGRPSKYPADWTQAQIRGAQREARRQELLTEIREREEGLQALERKLARTTSPTEAKKDRDTIFVSVAGQAVLKLPEGKTEAEVARELVNKLLAFGYEVRQEATYAQGNTGGRLDVVIMNGNSVGKVVEVKKGKGTWGDGQETQYSKLGWGSPFLYNEEDGKWEDLLQEIIYLPHA